MALGIQIRCEKVNSEVMQRVELLESLYVNSPIVSVGVFRSLIGNLDPRVISEQVYWGNSDA